jgi:uncharacterized protein (TIGR03435 family)
MQKRHNRTFAFLCLLLFVSAALRGQAAAGKSDKNLSFEVATVKPAAPLDMQRLAADVQAGRMPKIGPQIDASRATYTYMSLTELISLAYKVRAYQIDGPLWLRDERFDIEARTPEGTSKDDVPAMLRSLLEERFKLVAHHAQEEHKVLALVVGKNGVKLKESAAAPQAFDPNSPLQPGERQENDPEGPVRMKIDSDGTFTMNFGARGTVVQKMDRQTMTMHFESNGVTMDGYAWLLSSLLLKMGGANSRQVVDMTGLKGYYQIDTEISLTDLMAMARGQGMNVPTAPQNGTANANSIPEASDPAGGMSLFQSVEQMGLKLEDRKATVDRLVIDHVEKTPTED